MSTEMTNKEIIEKALKNDVCIFIDTCTFIFGPSEILLDDFEPLLKKYNKWIYVTKRVQEELEKHKKNNMKHAAIVVDRVNDLKDKGLIRIYGEERDRFADALFHRVFTDFRMKHPLMLISQDKRLCHDIMMINQFRSAKGYYIYVRSIDKHGHLCDPFVFPSYVEGESLLFYDKTTEPKTEEKITYYYAKVKDKKGELWFKDTTDINRAKLIPGYKTRLEFQKPIFNRNNQQ